MKRPAEAARLLQIPPATIRSWAMEYAAFLSPGGAGGSGRWKTFSDTDLRILHHINILKRGGMTSAEVQAALAVMQANDWQGLPQLPEAPTTVDNVPVVPTAAAEAALSAQTQALLREIQGLKERLENVEAQLAEEQAARRTDTAALLRELTEVRVKLGEAELLIKLYESGRLKPPLG
jgi:DNA-binding transcriptional MerR regulator